MNQWDYRYLKSPVHIYESHEKEVKKILLKIHQIKSYKDNSAIFASGSSDHRVHIWDMTKIGTVQDDDHKDDGPPELLFIHGGHLGRVIDLGWNNSEDDLLIASCEDDFNAIHVWSMARYIYKD